MNLLATILFKRFKSQKLASFYILKSAHYDHNSAELLQQSFNDFLIQVLLDQKKAPTPAKAAEILQMGHSDILNVRPSQESRAYLKEDFGDFFSFQNYKPLELPHRFVAVYDSHQISTLIANKLLKTLEEPQEQTSIFFMLPRGHLHLPTIQSRAITLTLRHQENTMPKRPGMETFESWLSKVPDLPHELKELLKIYFLEDGSIQEVLNFLRSEQPLQDLLCQQLIDWQLHSTGDYRSKSSFLSSIKHYQQAKVFHAPPQERLYGLLESAKKSLQNC